MTLATTILSTPTHLLFHTLWTLHSIRRPLLLISILCLLTNPAATLRKLKLVYLSLSYLILCQDKQWKVPKEDDPADYFPRDLGGNNKHVTVKEETITTTTTSSSYREKKIILVRHGESTWNDTFNPGDRNKFLFILFFLPNLLRATMTELYYLVSGQDSESWFFDSPLSERGVGQAEGLRRFLKREKRRLLLGSSPSSSHNNKVGGEALAIQWLLGMENDGEKSSSMVVSSNLRRAISTAAIGLADRFASSTTTEDDAIIRLLPSLQEISRNPDALSILPPRGIARPTWCDVNIPGLVPAKSSFSSMVDTSFHGGNKGLKSNGLLRLHQFCADVFDESKCPKPTIIAAGHSLFFRSMFRVFLPRGVEHVGKKKKLVNGGVVMFTLREATLENERKEYMIDPGSVVVVYGGFGKHTKG